MRKPSMRIYSQHCNPCNTRTSDSALPHQTPNKNSSITVMVGGCGGIVLVVRVAATTQTAMEDLNMTGIFTLFELLRTIKAHRYSNSPHPHPHPPHHPHLLRCFYHYQQPLSANDRFA
jgi:hypothetical protein